MQIGDMRDRITWQFSTPVQDSNGQPIDVWANVATDPTVWANIKVSPGAAGGERFMSGAEQVIAELIHVVTIRYRSDLSVKMRGLNGSRVFYIENFYDPTGEKVWLILSCREVQL